MDIWGHSVDNYKRCQVSHFTRELKKKEELVLNEFWWGNRNYAGIDYNSGVLVFYGVNPYGILKRVQGCAV